MTSVDLLVTGGLVYVDGEVLPRSVGIRDGRISGIFEPGLDPNAAKTRAAGGRLVLPGLIDAHVHLRDPGPTYKEDMTTGTRAAAAGGFTLVADMPNCRPVTRGSEAIAAKARAIANKATVDVAIWAGATGSEDVEAAKTAGAIGVKVFLNGPVGFDPATEWDPSVTSHNPELAITSNAQLLDIAEAAADCGLPLAVHLGEQSLLDRARSGWEGRSFAEILPELRAEGSLEKRVAAAACLQIAGETGVRLHFVHVPGSVVPLAVEGRRQGVDVSMESFFPFMTFALAEKLGPLGFNRYKHQEEIDELWGWIADGTIDLVASDHAPHLLEEKARGVDNILGGPSGYPELETSAAMMLNEVAEGRIGLEVLVTRMAEGPAKLLGVSDRKGRIAVGYDADLILVDPDVVWELGSRPYQTRCGWSPFTGRRVSGRVETTIVRGQVVFEDGKIENVGEGSHVGRSRN